MKGIQILHMATIQPCASGRDDTNRHVRAKKLFLDLFSDRECTISSLNLCAFLYLSYWPCNEIRTAELLIFYAGVSQRPSDDASNILLKCDIFTYTSG